jgi:hypothetical protein
MDSRCVSETGNICKDSPTLVGFSCLDSCNFELVSSWICRLRGRLDGNLASENEATQIPRFTPLTALMTALRRET